MPNGQVHQHMHLRRRAHRPNSVEYAYPSSNRFIRTIDVLVSLGGLVGPLVSIPQLMKVFVDLNVEGISVWSWSGYTVLTAMWLFYGLVHHEKPIIMSQILWLFVNAAVVVGAMLYR